ncbi:MAG: hypothetical protein Q9171_001073 [Xanthocarpia ochracea]
MTVVLANGTIAQVSSTTNLDLYWGMKGAGHNFGIVTEANFKIYDFPTPRWFYAELTFTGPQLERLFQHINSMNQTKELGSVYTVFAINPQYSAIDPIMLLQFSYAGTPEEARASFDYFNDLHPVAVRKWESLSPTEIQPAASQDIGSGVCAHGQTWRLFPLGLKNYNITANRQVYDLFRQLVARHPDFNRTVGQFENYAQQGVRAVDPASTAYANRDDDILVSLSPVYPPSAANDAIAAEYGNKARAIWHAGDTHGRNVTAHLNYANGDESLEAVYGDLVRKATMPIDVPTSNPSKICTLTYQCSHSRYFKVEEITSEFVVQQNHHTGGEAAEVSPGSSFCGSSSTPSSSTSSLSTTSFSPPTSGKQGLGIPATSNNNLALLRVVDPEVLCPSCTANPTTISTLLRQKIEERVGGLLEDNSGDETWRLRDENDSEAVDELLEHRTSVDESRDEGQHWWDMLDLDELLETDGDADEEVIGGWGMSGGVAEPLEFV